MSSRSRALLTTLVVTVVAVLAVVFGVRALPDVTTSRLPGAAGGKHTYTVTAQFKDALDLVPNSTVRVADVPVGRVTSIEVTRGPSGYVALATLKVSDSVHLPAQTVATISSTSLLGEKYVALVPPAQGTGSLQDSGSIPLTRTSDDIEVEQLLSSLGALLNGGGLQQLSTITREFSSALDGHEQDTRDLLGDLDHIVSGLNAGRSALVSAITSTARLSHLLAAQNQVLATSVDQLDPATGVLARQVRNLRSALAKLDRLSGAATGVIRRGTDDTVRDLKDLAPILRELGKVSDQIPRDLTLLVTYPFADTAVPAFSGVYGAVKGLVTVSLPQLLAEVVPTGNGDNGQDFTPTKAQAGTTTKGSTGTGTTPTSQGLLAGVGQLSQQLVGGLAQLLAPLRGGTK